MYHLTNYNLDVVYLNGSHYQMGYTIGEMYKKELSESIKILDNYVANFLINPLWKNIGYKARDILEVVKEYSWEYISEETKDELKGISEGSNIDINEIILVSLLPSLSKAHCTILTDNNILNGLGKAEDNDLIILS